MVTATASIIERLPPHNVEAEQSVLGSLLIDRDAIIKVAAFLRPEDFYATANGVIYRAILDLYNRREPTDFVTLSDELQRREQYDQAGGLSYLSSLLTVVPTAVHVEYYARIVERTATLRRSDRRRHRDRRYRVSGGAGDRRRPRRRRARHLRRLAAAAEQRFRLHGGRARPLLRPDRLSATEPRRGRRRGDRVFRSGSTDWWSPAI